jgi:predicted tellurium resistance membrane protein TerC
MDWLLDPHVWASLITLSVLEIVLGIDNLVFIVVLAGRLPAHRRPHARRFGLALALVTRLMLLASVAWIAGLTAPVFHAWGQAFSWRDTIMILGGLYLIYKGTIEIHEHVEGGDGANESAPSGDQPKRQASLIGTILQIAVIDIVFSLDSVITAVGMAQQFEVMVAAVVLAVAIMIWAANPIGDFINRHPTVEMLAFAFILMVGVVLVADGFDVYIPKGYIYGAIAFSIFVESMNILSRRKRSAPRPVRLEK